MILTVIKRSSQHDSVQIASLSLRALISLHLFLSCLTYFGHLTYASCNSYPFHILSTSLRSLMCPKARGN